MLTLGSARYIKSVKLRHKLERVGGDNRGVGEKTGRDRRDVNTVLLYKIFKKIKVLIKRSQFRL